MVNRIWPTAVAGKADSVSSVSASACHIGGPNSVNPGQILLVYGTALNCESILADRNNKIGQWLKPSASMSNRSLSFTDQKTNFPLYVLYLSGSIVIARKAPKPITVGFHSPAQKFTDSLNA